MRYAQGRVRSHSFDTRRRLARAIQSLRLRRCAKGLRILSLSPTLAFIWFGIAGTALPAHGAYDRLSIAVITPLVNRFPIGRKHLRSVQEAFDALNDEIIVDGVRYRLEIYPMNTRGEPDGCEAVGKTLKTSNVIAALGPVTSDCAAIILKQAPTVPLLTSLATETNLAGEDRRFFRTTATDRERLNQLVSRLDSTLTPNKVVAFFETNNRFAEGLKDDLERFVNRGDLLPVKWRREGSADDSAEWSVSGSGELGVPPQVLAKLTADNDPTRMRIFVFGAGSETVRMASALAKALSGYPALKELQFALVGPKGDALSEAPAGTTSIGDDPFIEESAGREIANRGLVLSSYETARFVLPEALRTALAHQSHSGPWTVPKAVAADDTKAVERLRDGVTKALREGEFDTITPGRVIRFRVNGDLEKPPQLALYEATISGMQVNSAPPRAWLELQVPERIEYLFQPVPIEIRRHGDLPGTVELNIFRPGDTRAYDTLTFQSGEVRKVFHPFRPGAYSFVPASLPYAPAVPRVKVEFGHALGVAFVAALLGGLLSLIVRERPSGQILLKSILVGVIIAWAVEYLRQTGGPESSLPIPSFSADRDVNLFLAALMGGWLGTRAPSAFIGIVSGLGKREPHEELV